MTSIGYYAFSGCKNLTSITIPSRVTYIKSHAFDFTAWLDNQPDGLVYAGNVAYVYKGTMPDKTSITIKTGTRSISEYAFSGCSGLVSINIPSSVVCIGVGAFDGTAWLDNQPNGLVYAGNIAYVYKGVMPRNTSIIIKDGTVSIGEYAFRNSRTLKSITIPNSVTSIGECAFKGCTGLSSVNLGNNVKEIGSAAFCGCSGLTSITIPNSVTRIDNNAFRDCSGMRSVFFSNNVIEIGDGAFYKCISLDSVHTADASRWCTVKFESGDSNPLYYAHHLYQDGQEVKKLVIPNGVEKICAYAFDRCESLTSVTIPNSVTNIANYAFLGCSGLTSVVFGNNVKEIGTRAFYDCISLDSVYTADASRWCTIRFESETSNPLYYAHHLYQEDQEVRELVIPNGVEKICAYAFDRCESLTSVAIPNSVTSIGTNSFRDCVNLYSVTSLINNPFCLTDNVFSCSDEDYPENNIYMTATLYVPRGRETFYSQVDGWKQFDRIEPTDTKFKLSYLIDGEEYKVYEIQATEVITPEPAPIKEGYTFNEWNEIPEAMPAHDVTVTGTFIVNKYKIRYYVGDQLLALDKVEYGAEVVLRDYTPEDASRYTFVGWEGEVYATMPAHDIEYHANIVDGIVDLSGMANNVEAIYDTNGRKLSKPQRGVNILLMRNGSKRKLVVK